MTDLSDVEAEILSRVSLERIRVGLSSLTSDALLSKVARDFSRRMAEQEFFSHTCSEPGLTKPDDRVRSFGGQFPSVGENIAMHDKSSASAFHFVDGWMKSPGHRATILTADWEASGAGVYADAGGRVFATQLFAIAPKVLLDDPTIEVVATSWHVVRLTAKIGRAHSLAGFVRNRFAASVDADRTGVATLELELPADHGRHHVSFGRRHRDKGDGWIWVYEGTAEIDVSGAFAWHQGPAAHGGCTVLEEAMYRVTGADLVASISGQALVTSICVVDGELRARYAAGCAFNECLRFRGSRGVRRVDIGLPEADDTYLVHKSYEIDTDVGSISTRS